MTQTYTRLGDLFESVLVELPKRFELSVFVELEDPPRLRKLRALFVTERPNFRRVIPGVGPTGVDFPADFLWRRIKVCRKIVGVRVQYHLTEI